LTNIGNKTEIVLTATTLDLIA